MENLAKFQEYVVARQLEDGYKTFGYELIHVAVLSPEERVDFILNDILSA